MIDVTGVSVDYITVFSEGEIRIYRQHETPLAEVEASNTKEYEFYLQYSNAYSFQQLETIGVEVINLPTNISIAPYLEDIMVTKNLLFSG